MEYQVRKHKKVKRIPPQLIEADFFLQGLTHWSFRSMPEYLYRMVELRKFMDYVEDLVNNPKPDKEDKNGLD